MPDVAQERRTGRDRRNASATMDRQLDELARMVDRIAWRVLEDGDFDETEAVRDLDALHLKIDGKPCQPVEPE